MGTRYHCDVSGKRYEYVKAFVNIYYGWASHGHDQGILNKVASRELAVIAMCAVPLFANIVECLIFDSVTRACVFVVINKEFQLLLDFRKERFIGVLCHPDVAWARPLRDPCPGPAAVANAAYCSRYISSVENHIQGAATLNDSRSPANFLVRCDCLLVPLYPCSRYRLPGRVSKTTTSAAAARAPTSPSWFSTRHAAGHGLRRRHSSPNRDSISTSATQP